MNIDTGEILTAEELAERLNSPVFNHSPWVQVYGTREQVETLSQRVALGAAEQERRRARRKAQKQARKRGR